MNYVGYGSKSPQAERQRQLAQSLMPQNIGAPTDIAGGINQLAQALLSRKATKKADKLDEAHRQQMAATLQGVTAGMSPEKAAFFQAFPELAAQHSAKNLFPDQAAKDRFDYQKQRDTIGDQRRADETAYQRQQQADQTTYQRGRDVLNDRIYAEERQYNRGRDQAGDAFRNRQFEYNQGQDQISNQHRQQQLEAQATRAAQTDLGKNPIYLQDAEGNYGVGQLGNGNIVQAQVPEGMSIVDPRQKAQLQQQGRSQGKIQGEALQNFPSVENNANRALQTVDQLLNHKGIDAGTGLSAKIPAFPGSDKFAFNTLNKQAQGQVFLQGFEALKGGGVITEVEGLKAEQALARINQAQSREDYEAGLRDYKSVIENGLVAARQKAGLGQPQSQDFSSMSDDELRRIAEGR